MMCAAIRTLTAQHRSFLTPLRGVLPHRDRRYSTGEEDVTGEEGVRAPSRLCIGDTATRRRTFTQDDVIAFAALTGDDNPIHLDKEYALQTRFKKPVVHGMLTSSLIPSLLGTELPGPGTVYTHQSLKFLKPVFVGDTITTEVELLSLPERSRTATFRTRCMNGEGDVVVEGKARGIIPKHLVRTSFSIKHAVSH